MKFPQACCCLLLAAAGGVRAEFQWEVRLAELDQVECWDPLTCSATEARVYFHQLETGVGHVLPVDILGPAGQPPAFIYHLPDNQLDCELTYGLDSLWMSFEGPGFHYAFSHQPVQGPLPFGCGLDFPQLVHVTPGDGCIDWAWPAECEEDCRILLTRDFEVPEGQSLLIPQGSVIECLPGVSLTVRGELRAPGTAEQPILFHGTQWDGLVFADGAFARLEHCEIRDVVHTGEGGALRLSGQAEVRLDHCLVAGNQSTGDGGAARLEGNSLLHLQACTLAHNQGANTGGVQLAGGQALLESNLSLLTHALPLNSEIRGEGFVNLQVSDVYPQTEGFPAGMPQPYWRCDPGYRDPAAGDFQLSYWSTEDSSRVNCVMDVSIIPDENDPDGTPGDMGAFYFDQHQIFQAARQLRVDDLPGDEGGWVWLSFQASPNDGSPFNPVLGYSLWMRPPGSTPADPWLSMGFLPAAGSPEGQLRTLLPTWEDQFEGHPGLHEFRVAAHSVHFPHPAFTQSCSGFSLDNYGPDPVSQVQNSDFYYDMWPPSQDLVDLSWTYQYGEDFDHFEVLVSLDADQNQAQLAYAGTETACTLSFLLGELQEGMGVYTWVRALDVHGNPSLWVEHPILWTFPLTGVELPPPAGWSLRPPAPNPFNPVTRIRYNLGAAASVRLSVWNLAGQQVAVLVDGPQAAGPHDVEFDARGLASGLYIYRLEGGGHVWTGRMLLAR